MGTKSTIAMQPTMTTATFGARRRYTPVALAFDEMRRARKNPRQRPEAREAPKMETAVIGSRLKGWEKAMANKSQA